MESLCTWTWIDSPVGVVHCILLKGHKPLQPFPHHLPDRSLVSPGNTIQYPEPPNEGEPT